MPRPHLKSAQKIPTKELETRRLLPELAEQERGRSDNIRNRLPACVQRLLGGTDELFDHFLLDI